MRDDLRRLLTGLTLLAALVVALIFWSHSVPKPQTPVATRAEEASPPSQPPAPRAPTPVKIAEVSRPAPAQPVPVRPAAPSAGIKLVSSMPAAERVPFPSNLPAAFTEAGFQTELRRVIAECKFPYEISEVDCTEFPCVAWGKWNGHNISPDECPSWHETFGSKDFIFFHKDADGLPLAGIAAFPPDYQFGGPAVKHLQSRANGMVQAQGGEKLFDDSASDASDSDSSGDPQKRAPKVQKQALAKAG